MLKNFPKYSALSVFALMAAFFSNGVFAQRDSLNNDLGKSFKKYDVVRINQEAQTRQNGASKRLEFQTAERNYELNLTPRDLRGANYRALDTSARGMRETEKTPVTTYRGSVSGETDSSARLTIEGAKIEGYFTSKGERFFIEPAGNYSKSASENEFVVYRFEDVLLNKGFDCPINLPERIEDGEKMLARGDTADFAGLRLIELATEADVDFVNSTGGAAGANAKILSILNMVEGVYETELNLSIRVVFQHTWSSVTPNYPYTATTSSAMVGAFQNYWNANFPSAQYPRDAAHLFSYNPNLRGQGYANIGVICRTSGAAYGMSGRVEISWNWEEANFLITAHEIGHNLGANHAEAAQGCANSLMNAQLGGGTQLSFCSFSRTEIGNYVGANNGCLSAGSAVRCDFEGDGKSDIAVWRPSNGVWYINQSSGGFNFFAFGQIGDKPVTADYDGDGKSDMAVYRGGNWYRMRSSDNTFDGIGFGTPTDIPAPADFDGDGKTDVAVFRNGSWFWLNSTNQSLGTSNFGTVGDVPVPADYDGDGKADVNIFRPSTGNWYRLNSSNNSFFAVQFGQNGDRAFAGDFDGDGKADVSVWRPADGGWYVLQSSNGGLFALAFGAPTDVPAPGDFDGDGKTDVSVYRPSNGYWYRFNSGNNSFAAIPFGLPTDIPAQAF